MPGESDHAASLFEIMARDVQIYHHATPLDFGFRYMPQFIELGKGVAQVPVIMPGDPSAFFFAFLGEGIPQVRVHHTAAITDAIIQYQK